MARWLLFKFPGLRLPPVAVLPGKVVLVASRARRHTCKIKHPSGGALHPRLSSHSWRGTTWRAGKVTSCCSCKRKPSLSFVPMCGNGAIGANVEGRADQVAPRRSVPRRCKGKRSIMLSARRGCGNHLRLPAGAPRGVTGCNCPAPTTRGPLKVARRAWQLGDNDTGSPGEGDEGARMSTDREGRQSEEGTPPPGVSHTERCGSQCCGAVSSGSMRASRTGQSKVRNRPAFFGSSWALRRLPDIRHG